MIDQPAIEDSSLEVIISMEHLVYNTNSLYDKVMSLSKRLLGVKKVSEVEVAKVKGKKLSTLCPLAAAISDQSNKISNCVEIISTDLDTLQI